MIDLLIVAIVGYLAGAIPFSYIAGKVFAGIDLRKHGSGNLGASNTFRLLGAKIAIGVLVGDVGKGFLPVYFAPACGLTGTIADHWLMLAAAFFAVVGHMFSVFVGFSGGKGVATAAGAYLALAPLALLITFVVFAVVFAGKRIVSLASLSGAVALPIIVVLLNVTGIAISHWSLLAVSILITIVVLVKHHSNIKRLLAGEEPALGRTRTSENNG
ncbi:MAG: glycerol-3-phosphate 1-O-acyltransferase PlsY [Candidatus Latescibacterota bacterium]|nr:MAG: glycerol-3-phosphate 1-O-acyltransferase PlsY [Candidatus Latescibacterota bacterium]